MIHRFEILGERYRQSSQGKWDLEIESEYGDFGVKLNTYCAGIKCNNVWVVRFDDDYGNNQWVNAALITQLHNFALPFLRLVAWLTK